MTTLALDKKQMAVVKQKTTKALTAAETLVVATNEQLDEAAELRKNIKVLGTFIKQEKEKITKPANEIIKTVRSWFAPIEESHKQATQIIDSKMLAYSHRVAKEKAEKEAKLAARVDKGTMKMETAVRKIEELPEEKKSGEAFKTRKVKKFEVVDLSKLPLEYHLANEVAIRKAMLEGKELEGVRYREEEIIATRY